MNKQTKKTRSYSIAEAKDQLARVVHEAEEGIFIELTRRNEPVAAIISMKEYKNFRQDKRQFWDRLQQFIRTLRPEERLQPQDLEGLRDTAEGRDVEF